MTFDEALDRSSYNPVRVAGIDLAFSQQRQLREWARGRERVAEIAEGILVGVKAAFPRNLDAPVDHVLAVVIARGQTEQPG